jgi:hypothetical protein
MKNTPHIPQLTPRYESDPRASRGERSFPQTDQNYQDSQLLGGCGTPVKFHRPAFFELSNEYFANEAARSFVVDTGVFAALILTAMLSIVNGVQAVATLIHSVGVL